MDSHIKSVRKDTVPGHGKRGDMSESCGSLISGTVEVKPYCSNVSLYRSLCATILFHFTVSVGLLWDSGLMVELTHTV